MQQNIDAMQLQFAASGTPQGGANTTQEVIAHFEKLRAQDAEEARKQWTAQLNAATQEFLAMKAQLVETVEKQKIQIGELQHDAQEKEAHMYEELNRRVNEAVKERLLKGPMVF